MRGKVNHVKMLLCVLFLALPARAQYGGGTGEPNDPYLIYTAEHMNAIGAELDHADRCFRLMADIDLSGYTGSDFHLIGTGRLSRRYNFTGAFDGNGHAISNFSHTAANRDDVGLFRFIRGAQIKDLTLINPNVDAGEGSTVGALVGYVDSGTITNCHVEGGSVSGGRYVGGLVGRSKEAIVNCSATSNVSVINDVGGGLVGESSGLISHCWSAGNVSGYQVVGGLLGPKQAYSDGRIALVLAGNSWVDSLRYDHLIVSAKNIQLCLRHSILLSLVRGSQPIAANNVVDGRSFQTPVIQPIDIDSSPGYGKPPDDRSE